MYITIFFFFFLNALATLVFTTESSFWSFFSNTIPATAGLPVGMSGTIAMIEVLAG